MTDAFRYRVVDEPRPGPLRRIALPPLLVFLVGNFFLPWGLLLIALNAAALNGPQRNREIGLVALAILIYFVALMVLGRLIGAALLPREAADYLFVAAIGGALILVAKAYVSQHETAALRQYLRQGG